MQVLLRRVGKAAEVEQRIGGKDEARFLRGFAYRRLARRLAVVDAALGQVPVALAGDVTEEQLAGRRKNDDAAAEPAAVVKEVSGHDSIVP